MIGVVTSKVEDKGFGFISADGADYFFHFSQCITEFSLLKKGDKIEFTPVSTNKGLRATDVEAIENK